MGYALFYHASQDIDAYLLQAPCDSQRDYPRVTYRECLPTLQEKSTQSSTKSAGAVLTCMYALPFRFGSIQKLIISRVRRNHEIDELNGRTGKH